MPFVVLFVLYALLFLSIESSWGVESSSAQAPQETVVVSVNGVTIKIEEVAQYVATRVVPEVFESALSKPGAVRQSIGNLYIIRRAAILAAERGLTDSAQLAFIARDAQDREAVDLYVAAETAERMDAVDWDAVAKEQYLVDKDQYAGGEEVAASHILISSKDRTFAQLSVRVEEVAEQLAAGRPFHEVAYEMSDDPSSESNRGSLGFFSRGTMAPAFEQAAFEMTEIGAISEPVLTRFGVHFIMYEGRRDVDGLDFESVRSAIIRQLKERREVVSRNLILEPLREDIANELDRLDEESLALQLYGILTGGQK